MRILLYIFLSLALFLSAQGEIISLRDFGGGLNVRDFLIASNQATECLNWDLSTRELQPRLGFDSIADAHDTIRGIYNYTQRNGEKRIIGLVDNPNIEGLCDIVLSAAYAYTLDTSDGAIILFNHIYPETPFYATWKGDGFISTGRGNPYIIRDTACRDLSVLAPGAPRVVPIDQRANWDGDTLNGPDGEYLYFTIINADTNVLTWSGSALSANIQLNNQKALITGFYHRTLDTFWQAGDTTSPNWDSVGLSVYRSYANPPEDLDSIFFYKIESLMVHVDVLDTLKIIDSVPDDSLGNSPYIPGRNLPTFRKGRGVSGITGFYTGSPTYIAANETTDTANYIFPKNFDSIVNIYTAYMVTYIDTLTGFESDSSRSMAVWYIAGDTSYSIGIPPAPKSMQYLSRAIYKSYSYFMYQDTTLRSPSIKDTVIYLDKEPSPNTEGLEAMNGFAWFYGMSKQGNVISVHPPLNDRQMPGYFTVRYKTGIPNIFYVDSSVTQFHRIAIIEDPNTLYFRDTVGFDSTLTGEIFFKPSPPSNGNYVTTLHDKLWLMDKSRIYWSFLDSAGYWGVFRNISLNADDGDEGTAIVALRDYIIAFKNKSQYIIYPDPEIEYARRWIVDGIGCIAPHSMVSTNGALIYLSEAGVIYQGGSAYLGRGSSMDTISLLISDLFDYTPAQLRTAVGFVYDNKYRLSFPDKDTTYVFDFLTKSWSIWDYSFEQAILYDSVRSANIYLPKDMLFIDSDKSIYQADTGQTDNGVEIGTVYKTGPIMVEPAYLQKQIDKIGILYSSNMIDSLASLILYDAMDSGQVIDSIGYEIDDLYELRGLANNQSEYYYIKVINNKQKSGGPDTTRIEINGIDIWTSSAGPVDVE